MVPPAVSSAAAQWRAASQSRGFFSRSAARDSATLSLPSSSSAASEAFAGSSSVSPTSSTSTASSSSSSSADLPTLTAPAVATWLYICSGTVLFIVVVGGVTRLTESGLSITEWEPVKGILPPIGDEQWAVEWEKYRVTPEGVLMNSQLDLPSFKRIFYMEWAHRIAGRVLGVGFILPALYFVARRRVSAPTRVKLLLLGLGIGFQGALGWYMVKSGLEPEILDTPGAVPRVSQYRLAAHLSAALALYVGMLSTAEGIRRDWATAQGRIAPPPEAGIAGAAGARAVRRFKRWGVVVGAMVFLTAVSGAFVAGLDAGLVYNEFPTMGGRLVPPTDELFSPSYAKAADRSDTWWRNLLENPTTVQFDHRVLAMTTFAAVASLPFLATRPGLRAHLPPRAVRMAKASLHAALLQVALGVSTLLYLVPVPLAAAHQANSVLLLSCLVGLWGAMRTPSRAAARWAAWRRAATASAVRKGLAGLPVASRVGLSSRAELV